MSYTTMLNTILGVGFILPSSGKNTNLEFSRMPCFVIYSEWMFVFVMNVWLLHCGLPQAETNQEEHSVKNKGRDEQKQNANYHRNKRTYHRNQDLGNFRSSNLKH